MQPAEITQQNKTKNAVKERIICEEETVRVIVVAQSIFSFYQG